MNFFKALININSLREDNERLSRTNADLANHNLELISQLETIRAHVEDQHHTINYLRKQNNRNQAPKPVSNPEVAKMSSNTPKPSNNHKRRGRKPKTANQ